MASIFQAAMKQLTQLLSEDLKKEIYELWEVSSHSFNPLLKLTVTHYALSVDLWNCHPLF